MDFDGEDALMSDDDNPAIPTSAQITDIQTPHSTLLRGVHDGAKLVRTQATGFNGSQPPPRSWKNEGIKQEGDFDHAITKRKDVPRPAKFTHLPYATSQTGLVYDVRMRFHVEPVQTEEDIHPEDPRRIHAIYESFAEAGLAWRDGSQEPSSEYYMGRIDTRHVTKEEVCLVHTEQHWDWVQDLKNYTNEELAEHKQHEPHRMDSVYMSRQTPFCAELSAGGAIEACRAIMLGKVKNVFAVIRPPGHHAEREDAKGFCFFDNVSIATKVCQREFGERCRKVFILDWDVHHGNGIQQANYDDPNVLYVSLHVHERGRFYPEMSYRDHRAPYGDHLHCGAGAGLGKNVNIPWSRKGMGDADYIYAFQQLVMPIATEFEPDLVIIAAGFDAAVGDMLGGCLVTPAGYAHMTHMLMSLANGRVAVCLEGGYNLDSIAKSATAVARTLMGEPPERLVNTSPTLTGVDDVKLVLRQQSRFWSSLYPKDLSARLAAPVQGVRMHDVVRRWQAETMWDEYEMIPLPVYKNALSDAFKHQVLATPNYSEKRPLLVILHEPPEVLASPDPRTGKIELHNTWLTDIVKTYVEWAVKKGFAVIDVNLPKHDPEADEDAKQHEPNDSIEYRIMEATQLLTYLWDNYIELSESDHVFLMGTNTGHGGILNFIKANDERAQERITAAISFVQDVPLLSCRSPTNDLLANWYSGIAQVFVANDHSVWTSDVKLRKRFGRVVRSDGDSITDMLLAHKDAVFQQMMRCTVGWVDEPKVQDHSMEDVDVLPTTTPKPKLPPVGNFALSPRPSVTARGSRNGSPTNTPPLGSFTAVVSPTRKPARSPFG